MTNQYKYDINKQVKITKGEMYEIEAYQKRRAVRTAAVLLLVAFAIAISWLVFSIVSLLTVAGSLVLEEQEPVIVTITPTPTPTHVTTPEDTTLDQLAKEKAIRVYLKELNAPMAENAETFVEVSEKYGLPWWLLPSIAVAESGGGKNCFKPYNPFGWGKKSFKNFDEAIEHVGERLAKGYFAKGCDTLECIHRVYNGGYDNWIKNVLASKVRLEELYLKYLNKQ